jgi:hypothetical protein
MGRYISEGRTIQHIRKISLNAIFPRTMELIFAKNIGYNKYVGFDGCLRIPGF